MVLATARAFAEAGAAVDLADIDETAVKAAVKELTDAGHRALALVCDVTDEAQVAAAVDRTVETPVSTDAPLVGRADARLAGGQAAPLRLPAGQA